MSKLSAPLKALIDAAHARPNTLPASAKIRGVYESLRREAAAKNVGLAAWLSLSTAVTMTMNSAESLTILYNLAGKHTKDPAQKLQNAELMREVGLKCIGFNGVPRTINCLGAFKASLPPNISSQLSTKPTRALNPSNIDATVSRGSALWKSIYHPLDQKLLSKLATSHPDLPIFILHAEYGALFSDPPELGHSTGAKVGRVLTSIVAIACLRAQTGVGPQVTSHVFGLRKAFADGSAGGEGEIEVEGAEWLASDEGTVWLLEGVDRIVEALEGGRGSTFAPGYSKL